MDGIIEWLNGKKTYITAIIYAVAALLNELGIYTVPEVAFQVLAAIGLITLRSGVAKTVE